MPLLVSKEQLDAALTIVQAAANQYANKSVAPDAATYGHGPGGVFSLPALDATIYNAMQLPTAGLEVKLPTFKTDYATPLYGIVTGQTATTGSDPTAPCGDWPETGLTKLCTNFSPLSTQGRSSRKIDLVRVGLFNDRSDFRQFSFVGDPLKMADVTSNGVPELDKYTGATGGSNFLNNEIAKQYRELNVAMIRDFAVDLYTGNPANNPGAAGGREYFRGLDIEINTGRKDAVTGVVCPASDSIVEIFNQRVDLAGANMVLLVDNIFYRLRTIAEETGTAEVDWALAMHRTLFHELTAIWPCSYLTYRCNLSGNATEFVDAQAAINMVNEMRAGEFLYVGGVKIPVIIDSAIPRTEVGGQPGTFTSSIYVVPMSVMNGIPVTFMDYFDFNTPGGAGDFIRQNPALFGAEVMGNGKFLMTVQKQATCFSISLVARKRLVLRAPYLAARITNVQFKPVKEVRSPFPGDPYFVNGGQTSYAAPSYYQNPT
jgi:hypothetical protein